MAIDLGDIFVRQLLQPLLGAPLVIVRHFLVVLQLAKDLERIASDIADGDAAIFGLLVHDLHQLLASIFGQRRHD